VQHPSCSTAQGHLAQSVHKAWLQFLFSLMVPKPWNNVKDVE